MRKTCSFTSISIFILLSILLTGCESTAESTSIRRTSTPSSRGTNYPTFTRVFTLTPAGTNTRTPTRTRTSSPTPLPTSTPMPLPSTAELKSQFNTQISPLVNRLLAAPENQNAVITSEHEIIYVPQTDRLHYIQSILHLTRPPASSSGKKAYVLYNYSRGAGLCFSIISLCFSATTQAVSASLTLLVEDEGKLYRIEKKDATGGSGSSSHKNLVERAVSTFDRLESSVKTSVEKDLQEIIGYACGIDMSTGFDYHRRVAILGYALDNSNWSDRRQAAEALGAISPPPYSAAPALFARLNDSGSGVANAAMNALGKMVDDPNIYKMLVAEVKNTNSSIRENLARLLGGISSQVNETSTILATMLKDAVASVRQQAAISLGKLAPKLSSKEYQDALNALIEAVKDKDITVRKAVAESLGAFVTGGDSAVGSLIILLQDTNAGVRQAAAKSIGVLGVVAKTSLPELIKAVQKEADGPSFKAEIETILALSSKSETLPLLKQALAHTQAAIRAAACEELEKFQNTDGVVDLLISALSDKDPGVREAAARALGVVKVGLKPAIPALIITLDDSVASVRKEAAKTLGVIGEEATAAVPALIKMIENEKSDSDRDEPVNTLGKIGPAAKSAVPILIQHLNSTNSTLKTACKTALKAITKVDFANDVEKWTAWWEENKDK